MIYLYAFFVVFFIAVLVGMGRHEFRRADRKADVAKKLAESGLIRHHKRTPGRA